ncbi:MAG TPA: RnfABCDGE type electron transport complex subunit G [bacterium]|nr:RnfABCDGE type electron transport complex subunit G [bacterium]
MMKNETVKFAVLLFLFAGLAGLALGATYQLTRERIAANDDGVRRTALEAVLPVHDNNPFAEKFAWEKYREALLAAAPAEFPPAGDAFWQSEVFPAMQGGTWNGAALQVERIGYGGPVQTAIGVDGAGNLVNIRVVACAQETPGLGTKAAERAFLDGVQYQDPAARVCRSLANTANFSVNKDGGDIAAVTGATISSRAVINAVAQGMRRLAALQQVWLAAAASAVATDAKTGATRPGGYR